MKKIVSAFLYSISGLKYLLKERAFKEELVFFLLTSLPLFFIKLSIAKRLYVISSMFIVLIIEALNSAIENTVDRISTDTHPLSKKAKDISSCAVFLALLHFACVYITLIFF